MELRPVRFNFDLRRARVSWLLHCWLVIAASPSNVQATDYFFTIGGGYSPEGNQASLEANVLFFQKLLQEKHHGARTTTTFFADGNDRGADLQVSVEKGDSQTPATDLLNMLHSFRGPRESVEYRNHRVPNTAGPLAPDRIESSIRQQAKAMKTGDRLFIYVTAHGGSAKGKDQYNTTISCWNRKSISARQFEAWLDDVPADVPVMMIMAQCYCGGFAHTIFDELNRNSGFDRHLRVGFFAQQHDLAAAGCRPDIKNDEEYSSFFWGAIAGRTRSGKPIADADLDGNQRISLSEAHTYAMLHSDTIDIPLRSTEVLLRTYSAIEGYDHLRESNTSEQEAAEAKHDESETCQESTSELVGMAGSLGQVISHARLEQQRLVEGLLVQLDLRLEDDVSTLFEKYAEHRDADRDQNGGFRRRRGGTSTRREFLSEITEKFPELGERDSWRNSDLLKLDNQQATLQQLESLPGYAKYQESRASFAKLQQERQQSELMQVKYQRLINTLEAILLSENLTKVAEPEIVDHYQQMLKLEESYLEPEFVSTSSLRAY